MKHIQKLITRPIPARTIYLAIAISLVVIIITLMFITGYGLQTQEQTNYLQYQNLVDDVESALAVQMHNDDSPDGRTTVTDLYDDGKHFVTTKTLWWGAYKIAYASASWKRWHVAKTLLFGMQLDSDKYPGLYLSDQGRYLIIGGETRLTGTCFLPGLGVRTATIEGKSYKADRKVFGAIQKSDNQLPAPDQKFISSIQQTITGIIPYDSILNISQLHSRTAEWHPFNKKTLRYYNKAGIDLAGRSLKGNIIIQSEKLISIGSTTQLENCICIAPLIYVESGFKGRTQLVATDSIIVEDNTEFLYPSSLLVYGAGHNGGFISLGNNNSIEGTIMIVPEIQQDPVVKFLANESNSVIGLVYINGVIILPPNIKGSAYCNKFEMKTSKGYYENHLLDAKIGLQGIPSQLGVGFLFPYTSTIQTICSCDE